MENYTVKLKPKNRMLKEIDSPTITGAIISNYATLFGEDVDELIEELKDNKIAISSAFPWIIEEEKETFFLPKPNAEFDLSNDVLIAKKFKKKNLISSSLFNEIINGEYGDGKKEIINKVINDKNPYIDICDEPHNSVNRLLNSTESNLFFEEHALFNNGGLYFMIRMKSSKIKDKIFAAINLMGDFGIGRDKSTGFGTFDVEIKGELPFSEPKEGEKMCILSMYIPKKEELNLIDLNECRYKITTRKGKMQTGMLKKEQRFFSVGSIFNRYFEIPGRIADCGNGSEKSIESGIGFSVRMR